MNSEPNNQSRLSRGRLTLRVGGALILALLVWQTVHMLLIIFVGLLLALFLFGLSDWVSRHTRLSSGWSLALVLIALLGLAGLTGYLLAPQISQQASHLQEQLPRALGRLEQQLQQSHWGRQVLALFHHGGASGSNAGAALSKASGVLSSTFGALAGMVVCLFVGLYLAAAPDTYTAGAVRLFPPPQRRRAREVLGVLGTTLQRWLLGRLLLMVLNAIVTALGLWLLGIPLALLLGIISGVLNFVPNFGPIIAGIPAVLLALLEGPGKVVYVIVFYVGYQALDGYVFTPLVQRQTVTLPPALTIASQALLGVLFGTMGVLLAVPLAAVLLVLVKMLYLKDTLREGVRLPDGSTQQP